MNVLAVWREKDGATLSTYARNGERTPYTENIEKHHNNETMFVSADELRDLVSSRKTFEAVFVTPNDAEQVLGWKVK